MQNMGKPHNGAQEERDAFASRLRQALREAGYPNVGSSDVARQYITRSPQSVSPQAVRKWLDAETLPRQHHIDCLAAWLNCDPGWLRYGTAVLRAANDDEFSHESVLLLNDLTILSHREKKLVRELVDMLELRR